MTIHELREKSLLSNKPQAAAVFHGKPCRITLIHLPKGGSLPSHVSNSEALLIVVQGSLNYNCNGDSTLLSSLGEQYIPPKVVHDLEAVENSVCILIKRFE